MSKCSLFDSLLTPYVDGELPPADREAVDRHVGVCLPCRGRLLAERAVRGVLTERRAAIGADRASDSLRARCAALAAQTPHAAPDLHVARARLDGWRARLAPLSLAATLVLVVAAAFLYQLTASSSRVMAAELTADHMKCFALNNVLGTHDTAAIVESSMASGFDWRMRLPATEEEGMALVGSRPCFYGEGRVAHIMFRHNGTPVSLFMLPKTARADELVRVLGHEAAIWSVGDRTFVLIARETKAEVERMAGFIQASLRQ